MTSETQSCEMLFQEKISKQIFFTKWKLIGLITFICLIFGILLTPVYFSLSQMHENFESLSIQMNEKFESFTSEMNQKLENLSNDIEESKHNEEMLKEEMNSENSFAHYVKVGEFGYFQKLDQKMSYMDGQAACHKLHGKIIESDENFGNATSKSDFIEIDLMKHTMFEIKIPTKEFYKTTYVQNAFCRKIV